MSLVKKWHFTSGKLKNSQAFVKYYRKLKIDQAIKKVLRLFLICRFGKEYWKNHIGTIRTQGVSFRFYDPIPSYLLLFACGDTYEPSVTLHMKELMQGRKNTCFLDIGSHFGFYTTYVATLNPEVEIHAFEPNSKLFEITKRNIEINRANASAYQLALSDSKKQIPFSNRSMKANDKENLEIVESITFDELSEKNSIKPDIVKIDVHGGEGKVLFGMKRTLKENIEHLYLELHNNELLVEYSLKDIIDLLLDSGLELFEISRFRSESSPEMIKISGGTYEDLVNQNKWTQAQLKHKRMIYARKNSSSKPGQ